MRPDSAVRIGVVLPELLGTYGDAGNAAVLRQRLRWRGVGAELVSISRLVATPTSCDLYVLGGGEDAVQRLAAEELRTSAALGRALDRVPVLAVCAGLQILGQSFTTADGSVLAGLGVLDVSTSRRRRRAVGEVIAVPSPTLLSQPLTGFENHAGATHLGPDATPLASVVRGAGNGCDDGTEGVVSGAVIGTYLHGPVLARNPELADLLLEWAIGAELPKLPLPEVDRLRTERLGRRPTWRFRRHSPLQPRVDQAGVSIRSARRLGRG